MDAERIPDQPLDENRETHDLNRRQRDIAIAGWCSFLAAAVGSMLLFAWVDPHALATTAELPLPRDRMTGYAIGFFFLWAICAASAALTLYMVRTRRGHPPPTD
jgi:hypothetical protein